MIFLVLLALASCTGRPAGIEPVTFDADRYLGTWYEIARLDHPFERGLANVTATYETRPDGTIGVLNRGFDPEECEWRQVEGYATFQEGPQIASLSVVFFWPFAGGYHVFELDREGYGHALVSGPNRDYLWLLARSPDLDTATRDRLIALAGEQGFPIEELILVDHREPAGC